MALRTKGSLPEDVLTQVRAIIGTVASGVADDGSEPVKIGGVVLTANAGLAAGQRGTFALGANGEQLATLIDEGNHSGAARVIAPADAVSIALKGLVGVAEAHWFNGATFDRMRAVSKLIDIPVTAITAGVPVTLWTPGAGKKFRILGWALSLTVAGSVILLDNAAGAFVPGGRTPAMGAGIGLVSQVMGNGFLSAVANNVLKADVSATGSIQGFVYGTEE